MKVNRRTFVSTTAGGVAAASTAFKGTASVLGANDRILAGLIGCGGMGRADMRDFMRSQDVRMVAVCDVWEGNRQEAVKMTEDQPGGPAQAFSDFRKLLEMKDLDVVIVGTPDHWHALPAVAACQAGKDVYVEKPLALTIYEGQKMVEAARTHRRVVQMGTQQRSGAHYQEAVELIRAGKIGKISRVACWNYENESPRGIGNPPDTAPPRGLDWDMYLGPAPRVPFNPNRFLGWFRWFWDYSGGKITDWGTHHIDIIHWAMNVPGPLAVSASGGKYSIQDNRETPDTLEVLFEYPGFILTYSHRLLNAHAPMQRGYGIEFYGTDGTLFLDRGGYEITPETRGQEDDPVSPYMAQASSSTQSRREERRIRSGRTEYVRAPGSEQHLRHVLNFLECVKSRNKPISDVETGHRSTTAPHLGNIALRVGRKIRWDVEKEQIIGDPEAGKLLRKEYRAPWKL